MVLLDGHTSALLEVIQPSAASLQLRFRIFSYIRQLATDCFSARGVEVQVCLTGSVPLKTFLPDGDIDITILAGAGGRHLRDGWTETLKAWLEAEDRTSGALFPICNLQVIHAEVQLLKCVVGNPGVVVDISANQVSGLETLCLLEELDRAIGGGHLLKRSILLAKAWCYYESRLLGSHHGLISTYALETMVLHVLAAPHPGPPPMSPLEVLLRFLIQLNDWDWDAHALSVRGPMPLATLAAQGVTPPTAGAGPTPASNAESIPAPPPSPPPPAGPHTAAVEAVLARYPPPQSPGSSFPIKHLNIVDPLLPSNNLGRAVSRAAFHRIRMAIRKGTRTLGGILHRAAASPAAHAAAEDALAAFFHSTWLCASKAGGVGPHPGVYQPLRPLFQSWAGLPRVPGVDPMGRLAPAWPTPAPVSHLMDVRPRPAMMDHGGVNGIGGSGVEPLAVVPPPAPMATTSATPPPISQRPGDVSGGSACSDGSDDGRFQSQHQHQPLAPSQAQSLAQLMTSGPTSGVHGNTSGWGVVGPRRRGSGSGGGSSSSSSVTGTPGLPPYAPPSRGPSQSGSLGGGATTSAATPSTVSPPAATAVAATAPVPPPVLTPTPPGPAPLWRAALMGAAPLPPSTPSPLPPMPDVTPTSVVAHPRPALPHRPTAANGATATSVRPGSAPSTSLGLESFPALPRAAGHGGMGVSQTASAQATAPPTSAVTSPPVSHPPPPQMSPVMSPRPHLFQGSYTSTPPLSPPPATPPPPLLLSPSPRPPSPFYALPLPPFPTAFAWPPAPPPMVMLPLGCDPPHPGLMTGVMTGVMTLSPTTDARSGLTAALYAAGASRITNEAGAAVPLPHLPPAPPPPRPSSHVRSHSHSGHGTWSVGTINGHVGMTGGEGQTVVTGVTGSLSSHVPHVPHAPPPPPQDVLAGELPQFLAALAVGRACRPPQRPQPPPRAEAPPHPTPPTPAPPPPPPPASGSPDGDHGTGHSRPSVVVPPRPMPGAWACGPPRVMIPAPLTIAVTPVGGGATGGRHAMMDTVPSAAQAVALAVAPVVATLSPAAPDAIAPAVTPAESAPAMAPAHNLPPAPHPPLSPTPTPPVVVPPSPPPLATWAYVAASSASSGGSLLSPHGGSPGYTHPGGERCPPQRAGVGVGSVGAMGVMGGVTRPGMERPMSAPLPACPPAMMQLTAPAARDAAAKGARRGVAKTAFSVTAADFPALG